MTLTNGSLFAGAGGLDRGLERAGISTLWQVENDPYAAAILARHWPDTMRRGDVRTVGAHNLPTVDLISGGFPCQDLSRAASGWDRPGLAGDRSGLWWEFDRIVGELHPRFVLVENVEGAWRDWVPVVRRALHARGYASVSLRVCAEDVGAPFRGARVFVIAASHHESESALRLHAEVAELQESASAGWQDWRAPSSRALGVADGVPGRMDRIRIAANAVIPAVAELVGRCIVAAAGRAVTQ